MKKDLKDWFVPWLFKAREYNVGILEKAMDNPGIARLMPMQGMRKRLSLQRSRGLGYQC